MKDQKYPGNYISNINENPRNILELNYNKYLKSVLDTPELKEYRSKKKNEYNNIREEEKSTKLQNNELVREEKLKRPELPKNKKILKNNFIQSDEEEKDSNSNDNEYIKDQNCNDLIELQLYKKLLKNKNYSLATILNNKKEAKKSDNSESNDTVYHDNNINSNNIILNACLKDKNIKDSKVVINLNKPSEESSSSSSSSSSLSSSESEGYSKNKSVFKLKEFPYFILNYCEATSVQKQTELHLAPKSDEPLDYDTLNFIKELEKNIHSRRLKNAVRLLLDLIFSKNSENTKDIFSNKIKNEFLQYWKKKYLNDLEEMKIKTKNYLFHQRIEKFDIPKQEINKKKIRRFDSCGAVQGRKNFVIKTDLLRNQNSSQNNQNSNNNNNASSSTSHQTQNTVLKSKLRKYKSTCDQVDTHKKGVSFFLKNNENNNNNNLNDTFNSIDGWNDYKMYKQ